ncbi:MAG TPA: class II aldolase/adducin family protein [Bryobacteraceae bacterium]|jgi:rhamnose utilization protein RhaD (predicted bifunctional aldolase and dehydrogenase)|nr:class II aldolase/adducin family protein [Bryobacteraceae bacterium]
MSNLAAVTIRNIECSPAVQDALRIDRSAIASLLRLSARIGRDPLLVHASSGNTSLKLNGTLWIKASGKWLANADQEAILVPVALSECLQRMNEGRPFAAADPSTCTNALSPSIETFMHAVLPQRFVVHVHCVNTLAWAVRSDAPFRLEEKLSGLSWQWIPYLPSGLPLARAVQIASSMRPQTNIFVLGNHGLVVSGEDCAEVDSVLAEVQRRLSVHPRPFPQPKFDILQRAQRISGWRLPDSESLHSLGTDAISRRIIKGGVLYPCQAIFLRPSFTFLGTPFDLSSAASQVRPLDMSCPFLIVEGSGILINDGITAADYAVLNGFSEVVRRIDMSAPLRYLTDDEVTSVLSDDGHRYRISAESSALRPLAHA